MTMLRLATAALLLSVTGAWRPAAREVPDRLDDAAYWKLIGDLSEPGGWFRSDNFISNEGELQYVIPDLQRTVPRGRVYVGVGPEQNYTYVAALEPSIVFIIDIRRQNLVQHLFFKALMETSDDRVTYLSRMLARPAPPGLTAASTVTELFTAFSAVPADSALYRRTFDEVRTHLVERRGFALTDSELESLRYISSAFAVAGGGITYSFGAMGDTRFGGGWMPTLAEMMVETDAEGEHRGYLANETLYGRVRDLHRRNLIVPVTGDFGGDKALRAVAAWIRRHDATLGVFYASNVEQYLFQQGDAALRFYANLGSFPTDSASTFVRSVSARGWVPMRNPRSRLAQITMPVDGMLQAIRAGRVGSYFDLIVLRP